MIYKDFKGLKLSALGMGAMRLPTLKDDSEVDVAAVEEMVAAAMDSGVNYYDTGWDYHGGNCETVMGKVLSKYPRDSYYFAAKFPGYNLANMDKADEIFNKQLEKAGLEYFDFYLFHNVCEMNIDGYLDPKYGIFDYLMEQKKNGKIRHLGFSSHGSYDIMKRFLDAYGKDMEYCQIQLNWLDWDFQDAKAKVELLKQWNIPVWVMEPLRGGKLASLPEDAEAKLKALRPDEEIPAWSFRFLQGLDDVVMVLSGMSNLEQLKKNIATYESEKKLSAEEEKALFDIAEEMVKKTKVPCTACRYCTGHCPQELDIPMLLELYNEHSFTGGGFIAPMALMAVPEDKHPSACVGCKSCESVCPQQIKISEIMADFGEKVKGFKL